MQQPKNNTIHQAIKLGGGGAKVARALGMSNQAVLAWPVRNRIPVEHIVPLCELGGNVITPVMILESITATERERQACEAGAQ